MRPRIRARMTDEQGHEHGATVFEGGSTALVGEDPLKIEIVSTHAVCTL
jgi:hypothetical protein